MTLAGWRAGLEAGKASSAAPEKKRRRNQPKGTDRASKKIPEMAKTRIPKDPGNGKTGDSKKAPKTVKSGGKDDKIANSRCLPDRVVKEGIKWY